MDLNKYLAFEIYSPEDDEIPSYMNLRTFIEKIYTSEMLTEQQRNHIAQFRRDNFISMVTSNNLLKVAPPLLPHNIPVTLKNYYYEPAGNNGGVQGEALVQRRERAYNFFSAGMNEYCKYLQYIQFPVQLRVTHSGELVIRNLNHSSLVHFENFHLYFWTYFVAVEIGRKFSIASHSSNSRIITLLDYSPNRTLQFYQDNMERLPSFLKDPFSPVFYYISFNEPHNYIYQRQYQNLRYFFEIAFLKLIEHEMIIKSMYGQGLLFLTTNVPLVNVIFNAYNNAMSDRRVRYNEVVVETNPATLSNVDYLDLLNGEVRGIARLYIEYMCKNLGVALGQGEQERVISLNSLELARDTIEESDALYNRTIENYMFEDFFYTALPLVGGTDLINHNTDSMFEINTDINESFQQSDILFRIFHRAYLGARDSFLVNDNIRNFLNNFMNNITHFRVVLTLRPENNLGQEVPNIPGGVDFLFDQDDIFFNWVDNISYNGIYPINLYNFLMERVMNFWEAFANYYEAYLNSFIYKVRSMRVEFINYPLAGGCTKVKAYHEGKTFIGVSASHVTKNCFFEALNPHLEVTFGGSNESVMFRHFEYTSGNKDTDPELNTTLKFPLTLSSCKTLRKRMGVPMKALVPVDKLHLLRLNLNFKVKTLQGDLLFHSKGAYGSEYVIYLNNGHYFVEHPDPPAIIHEQICDKCLKPASLEHIAKCRGRRGLYKKGDYNKFVRFNRKRHLELLEEKGVSFITADIETFPIEKNHVPYSIAFHSKFADDLLHIDAEAEKLTYEKDGEKVDPHVYMFKGDTCIEQFIRQLAKFRGLRYVVFHNGSRYDLILILQTLIYFKQSYVKVTNIIHKGSKILSLELQFAENKNKVIFWDSCLHLLGSLKSLCGVFKVPEDLAKGDFDHTLINSWHDVVETEHMWKPYLLKDILALKFIVEAYESEILNALGFSPLKFVTISSLANHLIKKDIDKHNHSVYIPEDFEIDAYFRKSIYGGRTSPVIQNFDSTHEDDYLVALDVKSLYPYAMNEAEFFIGAPIFKHGKELHAMFRNKHVRPGIYLVNVIPPLEDQRYPVPFLPTRDSKNTLSWSYTYTQQTYTSLMINFAFTIGYDFIPESGYVFHNTSNEIFRDSNTFWQDMKNSAERDGNEGRRQIAKIANNSGYGKQIEQNVVQKTLYCSKKEAYTYINTHGYKNVYVFTTPHTDNCFVIVKEKAKNPKTPTHLGAVILDYSKIVMYQYFLKFMKPYSYGTLDEVYRFAPYYTDTDSIFLHVSHLENLMYAIGDDFGKLDYDLKDKDFRIYYARFHAPKTYFFTAVHHVTKKELKKQRTKGFPDKHVSFESLVAVSGRNEEFTVTFDTIQRTVFNKNNGATILNLKNVVMTRTLNLNCFNRSMKIKSKIHSDQYYFVPFFE